jgi:hypothetical protein
MFKQAQRGWLHAIDDTVKSIIVKQIPFLHRHVTAAVLLILPFGISFSMSWLCSTGVTGW